LHTFDGIDLYPTAIEKATAIFESLIINHPFMDGNKRIAYSLMEVVLRHGGLGLTVTEDEKYALVIKASTGEFVSTKLRNGLRLTPNNDSMTISVIVAIGENHAIGKNNQLLWHMPKI
jgi:prophage maintenance system killer protein